MTELVRSIEWLPARDTRKPQAGGGFTGAAHCMECKFVLTGPLGVVELIIYTGWWLEKTEKLTDQDPNLAFIYKAMPADIVAHKREPWEDALIGPRPECHRLLGPCYPKSWGPLAAENVFKAFVRKGEPVVWAALEGRYAGMQPKQPHDRNEAARDS